MKHTKGKWMLPSLADDKATGNCGFVLCEQHCGAIATVHYSKTRKIEDGGDPPLEEAKANAKLITAAPEMLEALKEISKGNGRYDMDKLKHASNTIEDMKELAISAIKKATE